MRKALSQDLEGQGREKLTHLEIKGPNWKERSLERQNGPVWTSQETLLESSAKQHVGRTLEWLNQKRKMDWFMSLKF